MRKFEKVHKRFAYRASMALLIGVIALSPVKISADSKASPATAAEGIPITGDERVTVSENEIFRFEYDPLGADVYITDKRTDSVWSNTVPENYCGQEISSPNSLTVLMVVQTASSGGELTQTNISSRDFNTTRYTLKAALLDEKLIITVNLKQSDISFQLILWIDEAGLNYEIPKEQMKENGEDMLFSIQVMPAFGAAASSEEGYILLPDGSGCLVHHTVSDSPNAKLWNFPVYGTNLQDISVINKNKQDDIYNFMLPAYGISHGYGAMLAVITEGEADASINYAPGGYLLPQLERAYFTFEYRSYVTATVNGKETVRLVPYLNETTRTAKIFLLDREHNSYSDMATAYREYLVSQNVLSKKAEQSSVPLAADLLMGANEKGFFFDKLIVGTSYAQAQTIAEELSEDIKELNITLKGWNKGGADVFPTLPKAERKFGGKRGLKALMSFCSDEDISLYLAADFINANAETGRFNRKNDTIRAYNGKIINTGDSYILNPTRVLSRQFKKAVSAVDPVKGTAISFETVGSLLTYDYSKSNPTSRQASVSAYKEVLKKAEKQLGKVAVSGGNSYVLESAGLLSEIPDTCSNYFISDESVPFFQMVVHGYLNYTSNSGNSAYDLQLQKLRWIETGSMPYFVLTYANPVKLSETSYNHLFSSEYSVWREKILSVYKEFNDNLAQVWNRCIVGHQRQGDMVCLTYDNGAEVWINYSKTAVTLENGATVDSMGYCVIGGGNS